MNKTEIDMIILALQSALTVFETIDPSAANNQVVKDINNAISLLQTMGL